MTVRRVPLNVKKYHIASILFVTFVSVVCGYALMASFQDKNEPDKILTTTLPTLLLSTDVITTTTKSKETFSTSEFRLKLLKEKVERLSTKFDDSRDLHSINPAQYPNYNVHIFYYAWYGNKEIDGAYLHWYSQKNEVSESSNPLSNIRSYFYPKLGCYSSRNLTIINIHFKQIRDCGIGVILLWWAPLHEVELPHGNIKNLLDIANKYDLKIALHIKQYKHRMPEDLFRHIKAFSGRYANHPAYYKKKKDGVELPVFYINKPYLHKPEEWKEFLSDRSNNTVRKTTLDGIYIGLLTEKSHVDHIRKSKFDGFYTFFGINADKYGTNWKNWEKLSKVANKYNLIFSASVAPGYNEVNLVRERARGHYYDIGWRCAINNNADIVSINSFNDWYHGTQIEPAVNKQFHNISYKGYEPEGSDFYLNLTNWWISEFQKFQNK